tara:strand:+ start:739 stop:846 length:108 start_codon:yes stop_codon:yes gene_type:complete
MQNSFAVKKKPEEDESIADKFLGFIGCGPKKKRGE